MTFLPFEHVASRIAIDRSDSDVALFYSLLFYGEVLTKTVVAGMVSSLVEERDRNQYRLLHRLVRADGIGEWATVLDDVLVGQASVHIRQVAREEQHQLTQGIAPGHWQHDAVALLLDCADTMGVECDSLPRKTAARLWFQLFATLRNKTRGHAAPQGQQCADACGPLERSVGLFVERFTLFQRPWAYLHQNFSRKYRVTPIAGDQSSFEHLKRETRHHHRPGVYVAFDGAISPVELMESDVDASDFLFANGQFKDNQYEVLSYTTNSRRRVSAERFLTTTEPLPQSHTQGTGRLDVVGNAFANLPPLSRGYVERARLEADLVEQLKLDRHPIVTLAGSGGTGKTSMALKVLGDMTSLPESPFLAILWFSARDIDLLPEGAKPVRPHTLSLRDFSKEFVRLIEPAERNVGGFRPKDYFAAALERSPIGPTLFVFDNFETVDSPPELFRWIDTYVRLPNKVLITTRIRDFAGDYPIEVAGMSEHEAGVLIDGVSSELHIAELVTDQYRGEVYRESDGHPYVIKILLGESARMGTAARPSRIVAGKDQILGALFERSFALLSVAAQRVFLTLCSWRSVVPRIALEAILLRPENERFDVATAVDELRRMSLVEELVSSEDSQVFLSVPLAALLFGKKKLTASPLRAAVEADGHLLQALGAARKEDIRHGVLPRVRRLLRTVSDEVSRGVTTFQSRIPILEFIASRMPAIWLELAQLHGEQGTREGLEDARECLRRYLENPEPGKSLVSVWSDLADLCSQLDDPVGEVHAIVELCQVPGIPIEQVSGAANQINNVYQELKQRGLTLLDTLERRILVRKVADVMGQRLLELDATDCSRLAWLRMHLQDTPLALKAAQKGHAIDPQNEHCIRLLERLADHG